MLAMTSYIVSYFLISVLSLGLSFATSHGIFLQACLTLSIGDETDELVYYRRGYRDILSLKWAIWYTPLAVFCPIGALNYWYSDELRVSLMCVPIFLVVGSSWILSRGLFERVRQANH